MKRIIRILVVAVISLAGAANAAAQDSGYMILKSNISGNLGFDMGYTINDLVGVKAGMMVDLYRPDTESGSYVDSMGHKYRLSYTAGPYFRITDWFNASVSAGYGEIGTYGYSEQLKEYGISGKIKGFEAGVQLQFILDEYMFEIGYGTLPISFALNRPFTDISFGVGMVF